MGEHLASNIRYAVQNSLISTMKHIGMCEFDLKDYPESEITSFTLYGSSSINPHHCYGSIFYFKGNEKYCEDANIYFGCYMNVIQHHSLQNTQVQIERSNGTLSSASIKNNTVTFFNLKLDISSFFNMSITSIPSIVDTIELVI